MADTGNTATFTIAGSTAYTPAIKSITPGPATREALEDTVLSTTSGKKTFVPDDLIEWGDFELEYYYNTSEADAFFHILGVAANTITLTMPLVSGDATAGTIAGTGFQTEFQPGPQVNSELSMGRAVFKWDGKTGPTFVGGAT